MIKNGKKTALVDGDVTVKKLHFIYHMDLKFNSPIFRHSYTLRCVPSDQFTQQICSVECSIEPHDTLIFNRDCFGNKTCVGSAVAPHDTFRFDVEGIAFVDAAAKRPEKLYPVFRYASAYTKMDEGLLRFCQKYGQGEKKGLELAVFLMDVLFGHYRYEPGVTNTATTAAGALQLGRGVCQDYAHILIALCRGCHIPARYAAGMMVGEGVTHAWTEVYDNGMWHGLDPTHNRMVNDDYIKLSHGRDFGDCIVDRGQFYGAANQEQTVYVKVE